MGGEGGCAQPQGGEVRWGGGKAETGAQAARTRAAVEASRGGTTEVGGGLSLQAPELPLHLSPSFIQFAMSSLYYMESILLNLFAWTTQRMNAHLEMLITYLVDLLKNNLLFTLSHTSLGTGNTWNTHHTRAFINFKTMWECLDLKWKTINDKVTLPSLFNCLSPRSENSRVWVSS